MEIVIGATAPVGPPPKKNVSTGGGYVEAKVLNIRAPRRRRVIPQGQDDRRGGKESHDPASGQVMVLLIPEGYNIPSDIDSGNYRVFLRFAPRKK